MDEPLMLDSRPIKSGFFRASDFSLPVIDGYLEIKPPGFGLPGWFASVTINGSAEPLVNTTIEGELEIEDNCGERWRGRGLAKVSALSVPSSKLEIDGNGQIERMR